MELIYDKKVALFQTKAEYDRERKIIFISFIGTANVEMMIECDRAALKFNQSNPAIAWYVNALQGKGSFSSMNKFSKEELVPQLEEYGVKYATVVISGDVFTRFAMNQVMKILNTKYEMRVFGDHTSATKWLSEKMGTEIKLPDGIAVS